MERIKMLDSTFDSKKKKLPRGAEFDVVEKLTDEDEGKVSLKDAKVLVKNKVAKEVKKAAKPKAKADKK